MPFARSLSLVTGVAVAAATLSAQGGGQRPAGGGPGGGPTRLIVRALANGQPVADLKAEDLTIRVDGRPREVKGLELVTAGSAPAAPAAPDAAPAAPKLPAPFDTNAAPAAAANATASAGGREFVFLLDEEGVGAGQEEPVRKAIAKIMSEAAEGDRFGFQSLRLGGREIPPTTSRAAITEELGKFVGGGLSSETTADITCRTKRIMGNLHNAIQQSRAGRTLVLITSGLVANPVGIQPIKSKVNASTGDIDDTPPETCQIRSTDMEDFGTVASLSPANMFVLHYPQGLAAPRHSQNAQTGTENLAGVSNAEFIRLTGGSDPSISRIVKETTSYYLVTLDDGPGGMRRIDANVKRDGVKVSARPAAGRPGRPAAAANESSKGKTPKDMIATASRFTDVQLRAASFVSRQGASDLKVVTLFEPVVPGTKLTAASVAVINEQDPSKATQLNLKAEELQRSPVAASLLIKPGRYRVRVAATTAEGGGTVDSVINAELPAAGPLKLSTMLLGVSGQTGFAPRLQFAPGDTMVVGVLEVYGVPSGANVTSQFEVADSETGPALPGAVAAGNMDKGPTDDSRRIYGGFGIEPLQAGDYILRVKVSVDGKEVGTATRTFRKVTGG